MRRRLAILLLLALTVSLFPATSAAAKVPLIGDMDLQFNLCWPGPQDVVPEWVGTITIDSEEYGMAFFAIGTGKPFEAARPGSAFHFGEIWKIYESLDFSFDAAGCLSTFEPGPVVMWGYDTGLTNMANSKYHMNGSVEEAAYPFEEWVGRSVHMGGVIEWYPFGAPQFAPGTFRIN